MDWLACEHVVRDFLNGTTGRPTLNVGSTISRARPWAACKGEGAEYSLGISLLLPALDWVGVTMDASLCCLDFPGRQL